jgi:hypothetical protein
LRLVKKLVARIATSFTWRASSDIERRIDKSGDDASEEAFNSGSHQVSQSPEGNIDDECVAVLVYSTALRNRGHEVVAYVQSAQRRQQVRELLGYPKNHNQNLWRRKARLLLQSAQWLDIDKMVEHREPLSDAPRLSPAQLKLGAVDSSGKMEAEAHAMCLQHVRLPSGGSMFVNTERADAVICERCYFQPENYGRPGYNGSNDP